MLFVSFCKVDVKEMRPRKWHAALLVIQLVLSVVFILIIRTTSRDAVVYTLEGVLECVIILTAVNNNLKLIHFFYKSPVQI